MKNLAEAKRIGEQQRLTNVRYLTLLEPDDDAPVAIHEDAAPGSILDEAVVIAVVGDREGLKNVVFSTSAKTASPLDDISSLFEAED